MSDRLPYEDQLQKQWTDIPLPDENAAWDDMLKRLEEDDDKVGFIWWQPGCAWALLLVVLMGLGLWMMRDHESIKVNERNEVIHKKVQERNIDSARNNKNGPSVNVRSDNDKTSQKPTLDNVKRNNSNKVLPGETSDDNSSIKKTLNNKKRSSSLSRRTTTVSLIEKNTIKNSSKPTDKKATPHTEVSTDSTNEDQIHPSDSATTAGLKPSPLIDTLITTDTSTADTLASTPTSKPKPVEPIKTEDKEKIKKKDFFFSTGLALQQQLPIAGQKANPYSSTGRKSSLADYIPSVYIRLHKKEKWFIQGEFRYGAPQYSKEILYRQTSIRDTGSNPLYTTNSAANLKKTFYHQLPLSFHYHLTPNFTIGGGIIWNKFYAAISDQQTIKHNNNNPQDSVIVFKGIVSTKDDSTGTFARSYLQGLLEAQYRWKRLSFGARYAMGLQPYIKFTLPGESTKEEKNSSIQLFFRFELWRSANGRKEK